MLLCIAPSYRRYSPKSTAGQVALFVEKIMILTANFLIPSTTVAVYFTAHLLNNIPYIINIVQDRMLLLRMEPEMVGKIDVRSGVKQSS